MAYLESTASQDEMTERWRTLVSAHFSEGIKVQLNAAEGCIEAILSAAESLAKCFRAGNKVMICGNGGSAADSQHMAAEFVNRLSGEFERPALPAIALTTDSSFLTAYANDCGWEGVFERQLQALGNAGDCLIAISTSGNSENVVRCVRVARKKAITVIGLLGEGGQLTSLVDHPIVVPSRDTQHIQETLLTIEHILCVVVERSLFGTAANA